MGHHASPACTRMFKQKAEILEQTGAQFPRQQGHGRRAEFQPGSGQRPGTRLGQKRLPGLQWCLDITDIEILTQTGDTGR